MMDFGSAASMSPGVSYDCKVRMWNLDTTELVAGPFKSYALRFSEECRKLAILSQVEKLHLDICLPVD